MEYEVMLSRKQSTDQASTYTINTPKGSSTAVQDGMTRRAASVTTATHQAAQVATSVHPSPTSTDDV
jgi:hypothetical protein